MRRLAFMVLSGNADAHVKNWAIVYPDGLEARLAPVYDFVSTIVYPTLHAYSALRWWEPPEPNLDSPKPLADVTMDNLLGSASAYTSTDTLALTEDLAEFARTVRTTWPKVSEGAPAVVRERVAAHLHAASLK